MSNQEVIIPVVDGSLFEVLATIKNFPKAVLELVNNAKDAKATHIRIEFFIEVIQPYGEVMSVRVIDDGTGMVYDKRLAHSSICLSTSRGQEGTIGRTGTAGWNYLNHALARTTETKTSTERLHRLSVDHTTPQKVLNKQGAVWEITDLPTDHPIKTTGTVITWHGLGLGKEGTAQARNPNAIINNMGKKSIPKALEMVTVVDPEGREFPVKPMKLVGEPIDESYTDVPLLKKVTVYVGVAKKPDSAFSLLITGMDNNEIHWVEFEQNVRECQESLLPLIESIGPVLRNKRLNGVIEVPLFNQYPHPHRKGYREDLYYNLPLMGAFLKWLRRHIVPRLEELIGKTADQLEDKDDQSFLESIVSDLQAALGTPPAVPTGKKPRLGLPHQATVVCGSDFLFEITKPEAEVVYIWDASDSGGRLDSNQGELVCYTAGSQPGSFHLRVKGRDSDPVVTVHLNLVKELSFDLKPDSIRARPGQIRNLELEIGPARGQIVWDDSQCGGLLEVAADRLTAKYTAGSEPGTYFIRVYDSDDPQRFSDECLVRINHDYRSNQPGGGGPTAGTGSDVILQTIEYNDNLYILYYDNWKEGSGEDISTLFTAGERDGRRRYSLQINSGHPALKQENSELRYLAFLTHLASRIAGAELTVEHGQVTPDELIKRSAAVFADILSQLQKLWEKRQKQ